MGGVIIFKGSCIIGNNSFICQGKSSTIVFGDGFVASTSLKLISFKGVEFGKNCRIGWECIFMDTNFHPLYDIERQCFQKGYGKINIGNDNWFATQCKVLHSVTTPERCIFAMGSMVTKGCHFESYCVHGGSPLQILSRNKMRDYTHNMIENYQE